MPHFIKTGGWDLKSKAPKEYLNLDLLIEKIASEITPPTPPDTSSENVGVFYVSKNYTGIGAALVNGYTLNSITSTNTSYTTQLANAKMGSENHAYPDPWSARNAAMEAMTALTISKALIIVLGGNNWTFGYNIDSFNGSATGNSSVATTPDVQFFSTTDISSLLKHNIDYYFYPNTTLLNICKFVQIFIGYNSDASDTYFKSGIYGQGNFTTIYGQLEGLSNRMFYIDNARAEITLEGDVAIWQRACFFILNHKYVRLKFNKVIVDVSGCLFYGEVPATREGDTYPCTINIDVDVVQKGNIFFPYPSVVTASSRSLLEAFLSNGATVREKYRVANLKSVEMICNANIGFATMSQGVSAYNTHVVVNVEEFSFKNNGADPGGLITFDISSTNSIKQNNSYVFNIRNAYSETWLFDPRNAFTRDAASINNKVVFNVGHYEHTYTNQVLPSGLGFPMTNTTVNGEKPVYVLNFGHAVSTNRTLFNEFFTQNYNARCVLTGVFKTKSAYPVISLQSNGNSVVLKDAILISGGTYSIDGAAAGKTIYCKNVTSNVAANGTNVTTNGTAVTVDPTILNYL